MKNNDFMNKRLTKDAGEAFSPARYSLKSRNDAIISPYKTYELFFEITFMVIQKLGAYEDIGTPDECMEAMRTARACNAQYLDDIKNPLEPLKVTSALKSELLKLQIRQAKTDGMISMRNSRNQANTFWYCLKMRGLHYQILVDMRQKMMDPEHFIREMMMQAMHHLEYL